MKHLNLTVKRYIIILLCCLLANKCSYAQEQIVGRVLDINGNPLAGASVRVLSQDIGAVTNAEGEFKLLFLQHQDTLVVSYVGYVTVHQPLSVDNEGIIDVVLERDPKALEEIVVSTGYYDVPRERATGSFAHVDNKLLNRSVSTNILERLNGVVSGLQFVDPHAKEASGLRVRGLSTIQADTRPLIVIDNFPYEGDIMTINPNDVESITVLKDAAAASIWGARAGNGVIVINTKQGAYNQTTQISLNGNVSVGGKPNLFYSQSYLPSPTVMEIQKELFERGAYAEQEQTYIPSYVELLIKQRDGLITNQEFTRHENHFRNSDLRQDAMDYLYQHSINQQYNLGVRGGGENYRYALSAGYDKNRAYIVGDNNVRLNLSLQNTFRVRPNFELTGAIWYTEQKKMQNGISYRDLLLPLSPTNIYDPLVDINGVPGVTGSRFRQAYREDSEEDGLLDWMYRPLEEQKMLDRTNGGKELRLNVRGRYEFLNGFYLDANYHYVNGDDWSRESHSPQSYFVRDLVNQYTQVDLSRPIPYGGILDIGMPVSSHTHSARAQLNLNRNIGAAHWITALIGGEVRQRTLDTTPALRIYNYDHELGTGTTDLDFRQSFPTRPLYSARIPNVASAAAAPATVTDRFLSYFGNASYIYNTRYTISASARWDGSNLIGVKANQRGTALWSLGASWDVSGESFYNLEQIPYLRLRMTYGSAGNIDKSQSHFPTIQVGTNNITGLPQSNLRHPGNPSLRWEQVNTFNMGVDWHMYSNRIRGSIEYYHKHAKHLLGDNLMDPTLGLGMNYKVNYASLLTRGWDFQLTSNNLTGPLEWTTNLLLSYTANRVTSYNAPNQLFSTYFTNHPVVNGKSVDLIYSLPWYGLNPANGYPLVVVDGELTSDFINYYNNLKVEDLLANAVRVPPYFGSLQNNFTFRGIELGFLITYKFGHHFRRNSISPGQEYVVNAPVYHMDYFKRWQKPGDEAITNVPAWADSYGAFQRDYLYKYSEILVTRGDHVRIQDATLSYTFERHNLRKLNLEQLRFFVYARNIGILWRANRNSIDPDYNNADYTMPRSMALGLQVTF